MLRKIWKQSNSGLNRVPKLFGKIGYYGCTTALNRIFGLLPVKRKTVLFLSDVRRDMSGNFKFVRDALPREYEIRISLKADRRLRHSLREYIQQCFWLATSQYIFLEDFCACTAYMHVRPEQELIQLWHGSGAYKKFAYSRALQEQWPADSGSGKCSPGSGTGSGKRPADSDSGQYSPDSGAGSIKWSSGSNSGRRTADSGSKRPVSSDSRSCTAGSGNGTGGDLKTIHPGYKKYTKAIVSSEAVRPCFAEAFSIPLERVIATGVPRTDAFFDDTYKKRKRAAFYRRYPEIRGKKVILFAPTYRGTRVEDADYGFEHLDLRQMYEAFHEEYVLLFKWHPALYANLKTGKVKGYDLSDYRGFAYDVSRIREVNDLLFVTDLLITDYSSLIFDYALIQKPIIYFAYDLKDYADGRGLYFPFEDYIYGTVAQNTKELIGAVKAAYLDEERRRAFVERFVKANDGQASKRVAALVTGQKAAASSGIEKE